MSASPLTAPFRFGNDKFDLLLNSACSVWKKGAVSTNSYGQPVQTYVKLVDDVLCYAEQTSGKELSVPPSPISETNTGVETWTILMRPLSVDSPPVPLNNHHYLQVKDIGGDTLDPNVPLSGAVLFDITEVDNPGRANHHIEVGATVIRP